MSTSDQRGRRPKFSAIDEVTKAPVHPLRAFQFWLVILFEFFERGAYYGMMSVLAVYLTDILGFQRAGVGIITGTIQPMLYFLPIISGALADRFGYRRTLVIAFTLLSSGYFLTSQMTGYSSVFLALCVIALGAGTFKPLISGSIARLTTPATSTLAFGIYYWSVNLGAFLFPLFLVPFLKNNIGWNWVLLASACGTGAMLLPTLFCFKEPLRPETKPAPKMNLLTTLANAFEIIYSPFVLIHHSLQRRGQLRNLLQGSLVLGGLIAIGLYLYLPPIEEKIVEHTVQSGPMQVMVVIERNALQKSPYLLKNQFFYAGTPYNLILEIQNRGDKREFFKPIQRSGSDLNLVLYSTNLDSIYNLLAAELEKYQPVTRSTLDSILVGLENKINNRLWLKIFQPDNFEAYMPELLQTLHRYPYLSAVAETDLRQWYQAAQRPTSLLIARSKPKAADLIYDVESLSENQVRLNLYQPDQYPQARHAILKRLRSFANLNILTESRLDRLVQTSSERSFLLLFVFLLLLGSQIILRLRPIFERARLSIKFQLILAIFCILGALIWLLPGITLFARIICSVISITLLALFSVEFTELPKYQQHRRFLWMIFLYSGFWIMYFQMFGTVLWYVKAYVDATALNDFIVSIFRKLDLEINWFFDVEHVTVMNAGTIILLQLIVSNLVKNTKALPTMIAGILLGTVGMGILAISANIWIFLTGITVFSIGEMTAHPKFISYVGQTAPRDRVALYMGYIFLYGVIGSSIGSILGANLYVHFIDKLQQPRTLWLIFSSIGLVTVLGLLAYNRFQNPEQSNTSENR